MSEDLSWLHRIDILPEEQDVEIIAFNTLIRGKAGLIEIKTFIVETQEWDDIYNKCIVDWAYIPESWRLR